MIKKEEKCFFSQPFHSPNLSLQLNCVYQDYMSYQPGLIILEISKTNQGRSILGRSAKTKCGPKAGITLVKTADVRDGCKINKSAGQF